MECENRCPNLVDNNYETWVLFTNIRTQWRTAGMSGVMVGFDYNAVYAVADTLQIEVTPAVLYKLQMLEHKAVSKAMGSLKGG